MRRLPSYFYQILNQQSKLIVYALLDPITSEIRYIGKSCSGFTRIRQHFNPSQLNSKNKKSSWLKSLLKRHTYPHVKVLDQALDKASLSSLEKEHIAKHKSDKLLNMTDGGDGYGYKRKQKVIAWNKGKKATKSAVLAMRNAKLGRKLKSRSNEEKIKISKSNINAHKKSVNHLFVLRQVDYTTLKERQQ
jgi:hypothetical protein